MKNLAHLPASWQGDLPAETALAMAATPLEQNATRRLLPTEAGVKYRRVLVFSVAALLILGLCSSLVMGLAQDGLDWPDLLLVGLFAPNISWTAFAAATAVFGAIWYKKGGYAKPPNAWRPRRRTAILIPVRNEDVEVLGPNIDDLRLEFASEGLAGTADIYVLSDSDDPAHVTAEEAMARAYATDGSFGSAVFYRRRTNNARRKPGNLADWVERFGATYGYMLVLDADSRMSGSRIIALIHRMETNPGVGLIQTGVRLVGAESRFGMLQQAATRLYGAAFASGIAGWSGAEGNYWGHNALIRVRAFAASAGLPTLAGPPPLGGDILSHDFVEAAWLRRAGWAVEVSPDSCGSTEGGPETIEEYVKRDRRWCQGNLQHLRILFRAHGLHPISRLHLACGIAGYIASPLWMALVLTAVSFGSSGALILPAVGAGALILMQKLAGIAVWLRRRPGARTLRLVLHRAGGELLLSTLLAPVIMVRQSAAVLAVALGRDCGWKPASRSGQRSAGGEAWLEPLVALGLILAVLPGPGDAWQLLLVTPIALPLFAAPFLARWFNHVPQHSVQPLREPQVISLHQALAHQGLATQR